MDNENINEPITSNENLNSTNENVNDENKEGQEQPSTPKTKNTSKASPRVRLTTAQRNKIIYDFERGINDPVWEVIIAKNNKRIVRMRKVPLTQPETNNSHNSVTNPSTIDTSANGPSDLRHFMPNDSRAPPSVPQNKDWMASIQYYNVQNSFNEQLMKQIDELNNKITHQNNKHKKLKTKYKKLKRSIFSDDSDGPEDLSSANDPEDEPNTTPININDHETSINEYEEVTPIPKRKLNLRDTIDFTKYGFSPI